MKFKSGTRRRALEYEKAIAAWWKENKTFEKSVQQRDLANSYVFYDGPPFITGVPHHGTLLSSIVKDAVPRYFTMKGKRVERVWGWDCHGLPAENFVEKQLGIVDRRQIVTDPNAAAPKDKDGNELPTITLEKYITAARESMVANSETWESVIDRIGRWVDFRGAYRTMDSDFMESVWWAFKKLYDAGKIYEGEKVLMYDTKFATPVSKAEVTMDNDAYQTVTDPSVYVKFKLTPESIGDKTAKLGLPVYFLAWTTTPWTLPGNTALAVNPEMTYSEIRVGDEIFILAKDLIDKVLVDEKKKPFEYEVLQNIIPGTKLVGKRYEPLFAKNSDVIASETKQSNNNCHPELSLESSKTSKNKPVKESVAYYIMSDEGEFSAIKRLDNDESLPGVWGLAAASLRGEEDAEAAVKRGACEKLNIEVKKMVYEGDDTIERENYILHLREYQITEYSGEPKLQKDADGNDFYGEFGWQKDPRILHEAASKGSLCSRIYLRNHTNWTLDQDCDGNAHKIYPADYVSAESGTGIVHIAPAYGEEDFELSQKNGIPVQHALDDNGYYFADVAAELYKLMPWRNSDEPLEVWDANKDIAKGLKTAGKVWKIEYIRHEYPFNPRSHQRIMYRAIPSWFFDIQGSKPLMLEQNENINWFPPHLKHGRFAKNIEQAPDWNLSRDRFWATAMPVWKGDRGTVKVVGSYAELYELSGKKLDDYHRPWVDDITFEIDGEKFRRIDKVLDCWFESGSMPFAQFHYPFENREKFEANYPGDFIVEYIGQVRAWFYYVHAVNTNLAEIGAFGDLAKTRKNGAKDSEKDLIKNAYKNVITTGTLAGNDGRKMSKSLGNFTDPNELMDEFSADALRFLLMSSPVLSGEDFALKDKDVSDVARKLAMIWNMYDFFTMYAEVDGWEYNGDFVPQISLEDLKNPLDKWIVSRTHELTAHITKFMDVYNLPDAMSAILPFVDDASNWFVRRSRRRFWKSDDDADKDDAYRTLHYVLVKLAMLLAPFTPFLAEELYQKLTGGESVHLLSWPTDISVDEKVLAEMTRTREIINKLLSKRMENDEEGSIKIRQPLMKYGYDGEKLDDFYQETIAEEANVKIVYNWAIKVEYKYRGELCRILDVEDGISTTNGELFSKGFSAQNGYFLVDRSAMDERRNIDIENELRKNKIPYDYPKNTEPIFLDKKITPELRLEGLSREVSHAVNQVRKNAGLNIEDNVILGLVTSDSELKSAIDEHMIAIESETLATKMGPIDSDMYSEEVLVDGKKLQISLKRI